MLPFLFQQEAGLSLKLKSMSSLFTIYLFINLNNENLNKVETFTLELPGCVFIVLC